MPLPVPSPANGVAGVDVSAAFWNAQVRDAVTFALNPPICVMYQTAAQTINTGSFAPINFDTNEVDTYNGHSTTTNTSLYVAQVAGWYQCSGVVVFAAHTDTAKRQAGWIKNGTGLPFVASTGGTPNNTSADVDPVVAPTRLIFFNVGDFVQLFGEQSSGANFSTGVGSIASMATIQWKHS
jgi:hypothetical protein